MLNPSFKRAAIGVVDHDSFVRFDQRKAAPTLIAPLTYNPLSTALRTSLQQLTHFDLSVTADPMSLQPSPCGPSKYHDPEGAVG